MKLDKATNQQLKTIMNYDRECPRNLLESVVHELMQRGTLKDFIMYHSKRYFGAVKGGQTKLDLEDTDIIQLGYIGILKALKKFKLGKSSFSTFSEYYMQTEWQNHLRKFNSIKRTMDRESISTDVEINEEGETMSEFFPSAVNVERTVLMKVHFENQFKLLTPLQKTVIIGYLKGYQIKEIAEKINGSRKSLEKTFHRAVEKMGGEKISLKENSGMRKGA